MRSHASPRSGAPGIAAAGWSSISFICHGRAAEEVFSSENSPQALYHIQMPCALSVIIVRKRRRLLGMYLPDMAVSVMTERLDTMSRGMRQCS